MLSKASFSCGLSAVALLTSTAAWAQEAGGAAANPPVGEAEPAAKSGIEDIVVTARRREESLQSVPVAITALTSKALDDQNIESLQDVARLVPSLSTFGPWQTDTFVVLRAQGGYVPSGAPAVASYLDEVPLPGLVGGPGLFYDLQSVQVLKGAQGTLFGRNSTGGAILYETAHAENQLGGYVQAGIGNYNNFEATGAINLPVVDDKLLLRAAFNYQKRKGYTHALTSPAFPNGIDLDDRKLSAGRLTVLLKPFEGVENETIVDAYSFRNRGDNTILTAVNSDFILGALGPDLGGLINGQMLSYLAAQQALGTRRQLATSVFTPTTKKSLAVINKTTIELTDNLTFKNIAAFVRVTQGKPFDADGTAFGNLDFGPVLAPNIFKQYSEEAQLQGNAFDGNLKYTVGLFYLRAPKAPLYVINRDVFFGLASAQEQTTQYETSKAAFGQFTYTIANGLSVTAGARYTADSRSGVSRVLGGPTGGPYVCVDPTFAPGSPGYNAADPCLVVKTARSKRLTGNLTVDYQVNSDLLLYAAVRRGYRAGGPNLPTILAENAGFSPEDLTDYEVGVKSQFYIGGVETRANLALYHSYVKGLQNTLTITEAPRPFTAITAVKNSLTPAKVNGAELELTAKATPELTFGFAGAYTDLNVTLPPTFQRGGTPKYTANFSANYERELGADVGTVGFSANANWRSKALLSSNPDPFDTQKAYTLVNLSMSWDNMFGSGIDSEVYVTNLLNKTYAIANISGYLNLGYSAVAYGEPRIYGTRLRYSF